MISGTPRPVASRTFYYLYLFFFDSECGLLPKKVVCFGGSFGGTLTWVPSPKRPSKPTVGSANGRRVVFFLGGESKQTT